ncbi:MAG: hypothetical protein HY548_00885 [Elusimicrobia bacterium]|nr:hypothetical protein [Elusimicrobiota bacterium]
MVLAGLFFLISLSVVFVAFLRRVKPFSRLARFFFYRNIPRILDVTAAALLAILIFMDLGARQVYQTGGLALYSIMVARLCARCSGYAEIVKY